MQNRSAVDLKNDALIVTTVMAGAIVAMKIFEPFVGSASSDGSNSVAKAMLEQAKTWYETSLQDANVYAKNQHIAYATAYLHAARFSANDASLERMTGIDVHNLHVLIEQQQKTSSSDLMRTCPKIKTSSTRKKSWL